MTSVAANPYSRRATVRPTMWCMSEGRLNPSMRLWLLFAVASLGVTAAFAALVWPQREPAIVAELRSGACSDWRAQPVDAQPRCDALRALYQHERALPRTEADYDAWLTRERLQRVAGCLAGWAAFNAAVFLLGWSSGRLIRSLGRRAERVG
jgi:hypothetical protein